MGAHTQMHVYDNKITLWNDGGLPIELKEEDLKREHKSKPRNPIIANACFLAGYIDTWGRGTLKIIDTCLKVGLPEPIIKELQGGIEVSIFKSDSNKELLKINSSEQIRNDFGIISERIRKEFGKDAASTFELLILHPEYTAEQIAEEISKTPRTVENYLAKLKQAKIIERKGAKLGGYWEIL
jgi:ATP-dependent DNA helicase RecG